MQKVFIVHGHRGYPNGAWRPWLMSELNKLGIYSTALPMPGFDEPIVSEWVETINRVIANNPDDEIYLVGHSLGGTAILRYLENHNESPIFGAVLVSTPIKKTNIEKINNFLEKDFDFSLIKSSAEKFAVIHGGDDAHVPVDQSKTLSSELDCELSIVPNGGHLSGNEGWNALPICLESLMKMMSEQSL